MRPAALGLGDEVLAVRADVDVAVNIGPKELGAVILESRNRLRRRVAVGIAEAGADDGHLRIKRVHERVRRRGPAAVVCDLEHVQRRADLGRDSGSEQLRIDLLLDIAR